MCNGEHRPLDSPRVVASVAFPTVESMPVGRATLLELRAGSCRDRFGEAVDYVELSGELDAFTASRIRERLVGISEPAGDLVIDTSSVSFIDSAGLRLLEDTFDRGAADHSSVRLHDPSSAVKRLMRLAGVDGTLATCITGQADDDRSDASISGCPPRNRERSRVSPTWTHPRRGSPGACRRDSHDSARRYRQVRASWDHRGTPGPPYRFGY